MPTDYKSRVSSNQKKSLPGYLWLLSGLAIGLFVAFIIYLDKQPASEQDFGSAVQVELEKLKQQANKKAATAHETSARSTDKTSADTTETVKKKEQKFNFYTLLPELEVLIPEIETQPPGSASNSQSGTVTSATSSTDKPSNKQYILQVGSFQNLNDAEKLKANLAFLGLEASIQHVTVNSQAWHRVRTGPYTNKQQLYASQKQLNQNNINSISMELR